MDELVLDEDKFKSIARLPSRDVLDGQLAGVVASPLTGLVRGLGSMIPASPCSWARSPRKASSPARPRKRVLQTKSAAGPVAEEDTSSSQATDEAPSARRTRGRVA